MSTLARTRRRLAAPCLALVLAGALAGCSGDDDEGGSAADALAAAKTALDDTSGVQISLTTSDKLPASIDGLLSATGFGNHAPAFEGEVKVQVNMLTSTVPIVAVDGAVYAKLPFTTTFAEINPADYGAPDPADLMDPERGLSTWLTAVEDPETGKEVRQGKDVLTSYSGTLPGEAVVGVIPSADESADFPVTFLLDQDDVLKGVDVSGPFYGADGEVAYTIELSDYGSEKDVQKP